MSEIWTPKDNNVAEYILKSFYIEPRWMMKEILNKLKSDGSNVDRPFVNRILYKHPKLHSHITLTNSNVGILNLTDYVQPIQTKLSLTNLNVGENIALQEGRRFEFKCCANITEILDFKFVSKQFNEQVSRFISGIWNAKSEVHIFLEL